MQLMSVTFTLDDFQKKNNLNQSSQFLFTTTKVFQSLCPYRQWQATEYSLILETFQCHMQTYKHTGHNLTLHIIVKTRAFDI